MTRRPSRRRPAPALALVLAGLCAAAGGCRSAGGPAATGAPAVPFAASGGGGAVRHAAGPGESETGGASPVVPAAGETDPPAERLPVAAVGPAPAEPGGVTEF